MLARLLLLAVAAAPPLAAALTAEERAQCACTTDGLSGGTDPFWDNSRTHPSSNIAEGGAYEFIGCGAHKFFYSKETVQGAGYPYRLCYTYGGDNGCTAVDTTQKFSLNDDVAWRDCNGDYDCKAQANATRSVATDLIGSETLAEYDEEGLLNDWTVCCRRCRHTADCVQWDFDADTQLCRFFSTEESTAEAVSGTGTPYHFAGVVGYDDIPVNCWWRTAGDTCNTNHIPGLAYSGLAFGIIGVIYMAFSCYTWNRGTLCETDDVAPGATRTETSSDEHGSPILTTIYSADIVLNFNGKPIRHNVTRKKVPYETGEMMQVCVDVDGEILYTLGDYVTFMAVYHLFLAGLTSCLLSAGLNIYNTKGGQFIAKYFMEAFWDDDSGREIWLVVNIIVILALFIHLVMAFLWWNYPFGISSVKENCRRCKGGTDLEANTDGERYQKGNYTKASTEANELREERPRRPPPTVASSNAASLHPLVRLGEID